MKIGIITLPLHTNYGGILQAYALQVVLERLGHKSEYIECKRKTKIPLPIRYFVYFKRFLRKYLCNSNEIVFLEKYLDATNDIVRQNTNTFINKMIRIRKISDFSELKECDYDALVVGSDQVWRNGSARERNDFSVFLDFAENWKIKKFSYASSFGTEIWTYTEQSTKQICRLLTCFDGISVREESAVHMCKCHLNINAKLVLDPTLLLSKEDYLMLLGPNKNEKSKGDLMCYVLDESNDISQMILRIAQEKKLVPFKTNSKVEDIMAPLKDRIQPPLEQWLQGFLDAKLVITDSFHACVFSIIFNKPFICLGNSKRGMGRFYSLLKLIDQEFRLISDSVIIDQKCYLSPNVDLNALKAKSMHYLLNVLN